MLDYRKNVIIINLTMYRCNFRKMRTKKRGSRGSINILSKQGINLYNTKLNYRVKITK